MTAAAVGTGSLGQILILIILCREKLQSATVFTAPNLHSHGTCPYIGPITEKKAALSKLNIFRKCVDHFAAAAQAGHRSALFAFHPVYPFRKNTKHYPQGILPGDSVAHSVVFDQLSGRQNGVLPQSFLLLLFFFKRKAGELSGVTGSSAPPHSSAYPRRGPWRRSSGGGRRRR